MLVDIQFNSHYALFAKIIEDYDRNYYFAYCFYLLINFSKSNTVFLDCFILFVKKIV